MKSRIIHIEQLGLHESRIIRKGSIESELISTSELVKELISQFEIRTEHPDFWFDEFNKRHPREVSKILNA